jgi:hypothetical protein
MKNLALTAVVALLSTCCGPSALARLSETVLVGHERQPIDVFSHGYVEHRITLRSLDEENEHTVTVQLGPHAGSGNVLGEVTRTVTIAPEQKLTVPIWQPAMDYRGTVDVLVDGRETNNSFDAAWFNEGEGLKILISPGSRGPDYLALISRMEAFFHGNRSSSHHYGPTGNPMVRSSLPVGRWSSHWIGYTCFDAVMATATEMETMPPNVQAAIRRYVRAGGILCVLGEWPMPDPWQHLPERQNEGLLRYRPGLGHVLVMPGDVGSSVNAAYEYARVAEQLHRRARRSKGIWSNNFMNLEAANKEFPILKELAIPVRGLFLLMLVFAVVIGPVNLIWLYKIKRRIWMLWTVPAVSGAACLLVVAVAFLSEGFGGRTRTAALTLLDQRARNATTVGTHAFYSTTAPGTLHYSQQTWVVPQIKKNASWHWRRREGRRRSIDWTQDQHLTEGWLAPRLPTHLALRRCEQRRERLDVTPLANGRLRVVNGLGVPLQSLQVADAEGFIHEVAALGAGDEAILTRTGRRQRGSTTLDRLTRDWFSNGIEQVADGAQSLPIPAHSYLAVLDGASPFLESHWPDAEHDDVSLVFGLWEAKQ